MDYKEYYRAYEERYKTAHRKGGSWSWDVGTPVVMEVLERYRIRKDQALLELGCGEGRDARTRGYSAKDTIARWDSVRRGKRRISFPSRKARMWCSIPPWCMSFP